MVNKQNLKTLKWYLIYLLPAIGIAGKLIGWLTMTHNFFFDWVTEGMILLFLLLEAPSVHRSLNPGVHMLKAAAREHMIFHAKVHAGWLWTGMLLRLLMVLVATSLAVLFMFLPAPQYLLAGMLLYVAAIALLGMASYVSHNPYRILITDNGIYSYMFRYQQIPWEEVCGLEERADWLVIRRNRKADHDIEFEDLKTPRFSLLSVLKSEAKSRNIPYQDNRGEYD